MEELDKAIFEIKQGIGDIRSIIQELSNNVIILMNSSKSSKLNLVEDKLRQLKYLEVGQVQRILNCSRPWALELMKKVGQKNSFYKFYIGDKELQSPSRLVYLEEEKIEEDLFKIAGFVSSQKSTGAAQICEHLGLDLPTYVEYIKGLMRRLAQDYSGFNMEGEARIIYREPIINT
jgi:hypothetical protein